MSDQLKLILAMPNRTSLIRNVVSLTAMVAILLILMFGNRLVVQAGIRPQVATGIVNPPVEKTPQAYLPLIVYTLSAFPGPNEQEPNDNPHQANGALISGRRYYGSFPAKDDVFDFYYINLGKDHEVNIHLNQIPEGEDYDLYIWDGDFKQKGESKNSGNQDENINVELPSGLYYIEVYNFDKRAHSDIYSLMADFGPGSTPTATATPPGTDYFESFTNDIDLWSERRWTWGTSFTLSHDAGEDASRQGFLNLLVNTSNSHYVIASPLVAGKAPPYNIETVVIVRNPRETGDQYGIIFGGNYNGGACPSPDFSTCFTKYYEMRVRYFHDDDPNKDRMEMKLKRIDSHDENNNNLGPDLIEWTRVSNVDENDFIKWDIAVEVDGKIKISANDLPIGSTTDSTYINNRYFGVIVRTDNQTDAEAKFDYVRVD